MPAHALLYSYMSLSDEDLSSWGTATMFTSFLVVLHGHMMENVLLQDLFYVKTKIVVIF